MAKLKRSSLIAFACALSCARGHAAHLGVPNHLHQVQSLYVKPSADGTTGDLYVSATEDSPKQWLEQPTGFLNQQVPYPVTYSSSLTTSNLPGETVVSNQKRAILSSPPIQYSYAVPVSSENAATANAAAAVPYSYAIASTPSTTEGKDCAEKPASSFPFYPYPFHHYYAHMMSAFANAMNNVKDGKTEEGSNSTPQTAAWPSYYPFQYVMVDPSAWTKAAQASTTNLPTTTPKTDTAETVSEESD